MKKVDISADVGESFGRWNLGFDEELMDYISSANLACGFHAGDPMVMRNTARMAVKHGVKIGTHVGFPDLMGFGRRRLAVTPEEYHNYSLYQGGALQAIARAEGAELQHFTWHGAAGTTFNSDNKAIAQAGISAVAQLGKHLIVPLIHGPKGALMAKEAQKVGLKVVTKFFADRAIHSDGMLVARNKPGAVITDSELCAERTLKMVLENKVTSIEGDEIEFSGQTILVHGDTSGAVHTAKLIRRKLESEGIEILHMAEVM